MDLSWIKVEGGRVPEGAFPGGVYLETGSFIVHF